MRHASVPQPARSAGCFAALRLSANAAEKAQSAFSKSLFASFSSEKEEKPAICTMPASFPPDQNQKLNTETETGTGTPKIKLCGLRRPADIQVANELGPEFVGFVFAPNSRRAISPETAATLKQQLRPDILAVGVFVDAAPETVAALLEAGVIDLAQLHGGEDQAYFEELRRRTHKPLIQAYRVRSQADALAAAKSTADYLLLDSGAGTGQTFDWSLVVEPGRPWFLAGGLTPENVAEAVSGLKPWAVDVSSGIETDGDKDPQKMRAFVYAVRKKEGT